MEFREYIYMNYLTILLLNRFNRYISRPLFITFLGKIKTPFDLT
jgi:hypothetical protein